jgi:thiol-disulfide isomerase/thioredoxin
MRRIFKCLFFFLVITAQFTFSQKKIDLTVRFPFNIDYSKLAVFYDNGQYEKKIQPVIKEGTFTLSDSCYSRYATITFCYPDSTETDGAPAFSFFIDEHPAEIKFYTDSLSNNPFRNYRLMNADALSELGSDEYGRFIAGDFADVRSFYTKNKDSIYLNSELNKIFDAKLEKLANTTIAFLKSMPMRYYSLWFFKHEISGERSIKADSLLRFYNQFFPDSLKQTYEGKEIENNLKGRSSTKKGGEAPDFTEKDIDGNLVSLNKLRGKYILLDFWASWCGPCIRLTPTIRAMRSKYPIDKLEIISVTLDNNYKEFQTALKKNNQNWTQIFNGHDMINKYAIAPIPQIYLIDTNGIVLYNMEEENDYELSKLKRIMEEL